MIESWQHCKNILVIRADNMGDLIMSGPAIKALKQTSSAHITLLTSSMAAGITPFIADIDDVMIFDLPWVKAHEALPGNEILNLGEQLRHKNFEAAVIFSVFSQNPLPAAMIAFMAGIPLRLAYCRENPYRLLTHWLPDKEPYSFIQHQVERDLALVQSVGATTDDIHLHLRLRDPGKESLQHLLQNTGINIDRPWLIFHPGVSEKKRQYPESNWIDAAKKIIVELETQVLFTGVLSEKPLCDRLAKAIGTDAFSVAGLFSLEQFISLVKQASLVVSVNTGTVHIAAAVNTPVVVLYAQTNPQHTPWMVANRVLEFGVETENRSQNEVIQYLYRTLYELPKPVPNADEVFQAVSELLVISEGAT